MAELKTKPTGVSVDAHLAAIADPERRADCVEVAKMMKRAAKADGKMWGSSIVGFGLIHYVYESGREGDWPPLGFANRKGDITLYLMGGLDEAILKRLGKHKRGKGCLYIKRLADVDKKVLVELMGSAQTKLKVIQAERKKAAKA